MKSSGYSSRRDLLVRATTVAGAMTLGAPWLTAATARALQQDTVPPAGTSAADLASDEAYWARVRSAYDLHPDVVNLDHGWTNPSMRAATDAVVRGARDLEALPAEMLPRLWETVSTTRVRGLLAEAMRVPASEIALVRNATEALDTVLLGVPLRAGDEVVCSPHDYYGMLDALDQRRARDGIVLRIVELPLPAPSMAELERLYATAIGPRTRVVLLTHPSNLTGQLLPVRRLADLAHAAGAEVVVDGAQSLGVLDDPVRSLGCDYYGASAHKWLGTPVGLGVLWMRPEHVSKVWPLVPSPLGEKGMGRFEWIGTAPEYVTTAAAPAIEWHVTLGAARKAARLRHLAAAVREAVRLAADDARFYADDGPESTCALTTFEIPGVDSSALQSALRQTHGMLVQAMTGIRHAPSIRGIRVSPNVYTPATDIERFGEALRVEVARLRGA